MSSKLSVVVPIYNVERYIRKCLDSIVNQTYRNLEIILIDDGSPDNCGVICDEYAKMDERIRVVHQTNAGVSAARNNGIDLATGEWITFIDSDDWCDKNYFERMLEALRNEDVSIINSGGCFAEYPNVQVVRISFRERQLLEGRASKDLLMAKAICAQCGAQGEANANSLGCCWDKFFKVDFLRREKLRFDTKLHPLEDFLFTFAAFDKAERVIAAECIGYHYREYVVSSSTHRFNPNMPDMCVRCQRILSSYLENRDNNELIQQAIAVRSLMLISGYACNCYFFHDDNPKKYHVIASELREFKEIPGFYAAIHSNDNRFLSTKQIVLKYILRLPWIWPLKLAYEIRHLI